MRILVVGSGARESALCERLVKDVRHTDRSCVVCAPGHEQMPPGMFVIPSVAAALEQYPWDLVIVCDETYLRQGVATICQANGTPCFGPTPDAARIETDKAFGYETMTRARVRLPRATSRH
jgi:phosphoribosylamine--glycine ligase